MTVKGFHALLHGGCQELMHSKHVWLCEGVIFVKDTALEASCSECVPVDPSDVRYVYVGHAELWMTLCQTYMH